MRNRFAGLATGSSGSLTALALGASLTNSATSITFNAALTYNNGTAVPTVASPNYIPLAILDSGGLLSEIVYLTAYTTGGTSGTIVRGREGTTGVAHSSGDKIVHDATPLDVPRAAAYSPPSGIMTIDEFNDESLDSAWVQVDKSGKAGLIAWVEQGDILSALSTGTDTSGELHALMMPLTNFGGSLATSDAIVTCMNMVGPDGQNPVSFTLAGVLVADGVTSGAGVQALAGAYNGSFFTAVPWTNYQSQGTISQTAVTFNAGQWLWIRLVKLASNVWRTDYSPNGVHWFIGTPSITSNFTPTHVGLALENTASSKSIVSFECLRRMTGVS